MNLPKKPHTQAIAINPEFGSHAVNGWRFVLHAVFFFFFCLMKGKSIGSREEN